MRKAIAYHEAGHALMAVLLGLEFEDVDVAESPELLRRTARYSLYQMGRLTHAPLSDGFRQALDEAYWHDMNPNPENRLAIDKYIMCALAGELATELAGLELEGEMSSSDRRMAVDFALRVCGYAAETAMYLKRLNIKTREVLQAHRVELEAIVAALTDRGVLTQNEVKHVVNRL